MSVTRYDVTRRGGTERQTGWLRHSVGGGGGGGGGGFVDKLRCGSYVGSRAWRQSPVVVRAKKK